MTQKARVLAILKAAGTEGVRSDHFFRSHMPRAAARIQELRDEGHNITSTREGKYTRYRLVEVGAGNCIEGRSSWRNDEPASADLSESKLAAEAPTAAGGNDRGASSPSPLSSQEAAPLGQLFTPAPLSAFTDQEAA